MQESQALVFFHYALNCFVWGFIGGFGLGSAKPSSQEASNSHQSSAAPHESNVVLKAPSLSRFTSKNKQYLHLCSLFRKVSSGFIIYALVCMNIITL